MVPHPLFVACTIPEEATVGRWRLTMLSEGDLEEDWAAVSGSAAGLQDFFPGWPGGITKEENRRDLVHHHVEFASRRSYAWVIREADGRYVGCAYIQPGWDPDAPVDAPFWFRAGEETAEGAFAEAWRAWLAGPPWPAMAVSVRAPSLPTPG